jgi:hypothetical protein
VIRIVAVDADVDTVWTVRFGRRIGRSVGVTD